VDAFVIWTPVRSSDTAAVARKVASELEGEDRLHQYWDAKRRVGRSLRDKVDVGKSPIVWDAYLLFAKGGKWGARPRAWVHQLAGADPEHSAIGKLPGALRKLVGLADGEPKAPRPPKERITIDPRTQPTVPEFVLEDILEEMAKARGPEFAKTAAEIRRRFRAGLKPYRDKIPKGARLGGGLVVLPESECAPAKPADRASGR